MNLELVCRGVFWGVFMGVFALCIDLELNWKLCLFIVIGEQVSRFVYGEKWR